jgi:hypothetical protein
MQNSYVLGKNKKVFTLSDFPQINTGEQVGIFYTGDFKSHMIALIAKQLYGIENIVFIGLVRSEHEAEESSNSLNYSFSQGVKNLNGMNIYSNFKNFDKSVDFSVTSQTDYMVDNIKTAFPKIRYLLSGYTSVLEETVNFLENVGWHKGLVTREELRSILENNKNNYPNLHRRVNTFKGYIPMTLPHQFYHEMLRYLNCAIRPFKNLDDYEILEIYDANNLLPELSKTISCEINKDDLHCGKCISCNERKYAFSLAKLPDLTKYSLN